MRGSGASIMDIARTLGIGVGSVHRAIVADMKENPPSQSTGEAGSTNPGGSALSVTDDGSRVPDAPLTKQPNGGK